MTTAHDIIPFSLKDVPSLIERVLPVQRISIDTFREREARQSQTLTGLGSYWKGRKPLVLNRACVLASLLPATADAKKDLAIFEMLMGMDDLSMKKRMQLTVDDQLPAAPYRDLAISAKRSEDLWDTVHTHIWDTVNSHLGTNASNHAQLVDQLGVMRFGHRPRVADTFSGSGQIPFEAARLGCDVFASDLNPVACMLTWGSFNIVGANEQIRRDIEKGQQDLLRMVRAEIDRIGIESDGNGWRGKAYLYCLETICPSSGWRVPVLPTLLVSKGKRVTAKLEPDRVNKRYEIKLITNASDTQLKAAETGTYVDQSLVHVVDGVEHRTKISSIRGDYSETIDGVRVSKNRLRQWRLADVDFYSDDIYSEKALRGSMDKGRWQRPPRH